jgi:hypothetical protein
MRILLWMVVGFHFLILIGNIVSAIIIPFIFPIPLSLVLETLLANLLYGHCPITDLENKVRKRLGMPPISDFLKHYLRWDFDTDVKK